MSRRPDYIVRGLHKQTNKKGTIGAAWLKEDGSISIAINPFITIPVNEDLVITLFKFEEKDSRDVEGTEEPCTVVPFK